MTPDEIRAEVERRKQRARDLKIREILWFLEERFRAYRIWLREESQYCARLVYPGIELSDDGGRLSIPQGNCQLGYSKGPVSPDDSGDLRYETTRGTLTLKLNGERVFEFELEEMSEHTRDGPLFHRKLGEIISFIEGPWVAEIADFVQKVKEHEQRAREEQDAPQKAREAEDLRKRFGVK